MRKLSTWIGWSVVALLVATSVQAAEQTDYAIGKVAGSELKIGLGPRPVAMGEAFVGKADDVNATAWNPAGLAQIKGYNLGFMHDMYLVDTSLEYVAYAQNLFEGAGLGCHVMMLDFGSMERWKIESDQPVRDGDFRPMVFAFTAGYGQWVMDTLAIGGNVKILNQNIDTEAYSAVAVDLGLIFDPKVEGFQVGLAVQNLGTSLGGSQLPLNAKAGMAYVMPMKASEKDVWNVLLDVNLPFGDVNYTSANIGTEYWISGLVAARVGYKVKDAGGLSGITGLTAGAGTKIPVGETFGLTIDYALVSFGDLGLTHQIALGALFQ